MKRILPLMFVVAGGLWLASMFSIAASAHQWRVASPDHGQTFAYGSERHRAWMMLGPDRHLALVMELTNDPYVDIDNPRQYDSFIFSFPRVSLGRDGRTFYFHDANGRSIPVAERRPGFLGIDEIKLLPNASLNVDKTHGYLSLELVVMEPGAVASMAGNLVVLVHQPHLV